MTSLGKDVPWSARNTDLTKRVRFHSEIPVATGKRKKQKCNMGEFMQMPMIKLKEKG